MINAIVLVHLNHEKILLFFNLIVTVIISDGQRIVYADYSIKADNPFKIIGKVENNIIVWNFIDKQNASRILIFNNKMKLMQKVSSDILSSDINPDPSFFNNTDSFSITYQYKKNSVWKFKIAYFNRVGKILSDKTLDSLIVNDYKSDSTYYNYKFLQSADKQTICFARMMYDKEHFVLHFNCTFLRRE